MSSACNTSHPTASARPPVPSIMRAVSWFPCSETSATTTLAPSRANASAAARPIPFAAPVTNATFPAKLPFPFGIIRSCSHSPPWAGTGSPAVLVVAPFLQPIDRRAVELLLNGDVGHAGGRGGAVPVLLAGCKPDHVARPDLLDRPTLALHPAAAGGDD